MKARNSLVLLLIVTVAVALFPTLRGIAAGWTPAGDAPLVTAAAGATVETAAFAVG